MLEKIHILKLIKTNIFTDKLWLCHGHQNGAHITKVNCEENIMYRLNIEVSIKLFHFSNKLKCFTNKLIITFFIMTTL